MKVVLGEKKAEIKPTYPRIKCYRGLIVYFTAYHRGIVLHDPSSDFPPFSENDGFDGSKFEDYDGSITFQND